MSDILIPRENLDPDVFKGRNENYLKAFAVLACKENSEKYAVELRRSRRQERTAKRRGLIGPQKSDSYLSSLFKGEYNISQIPIALVKCNADLASSTVAPMKKLEIIRTILEDDTVTDTIVEGLSTISDVLGYDDEVSSEIFFYMNFLPIFIKYADWKYGSHIVYPATVCLANLTANEKDFDELIINSGGLDALFRVINKRSLQTSALALKGIANLIQGSNRTLAIIKSQRFLHQMSCFIEENNEIHCEFLNSLCFFILNATNNIDSFSPEEAGLIAEWTEKCIDLEAQSIEKDLLRAIYNLACMPFACIKSKKIFNFLIAKTNHFLAVKSISNIMFHSSEEAEYFLKLNLLDKLLMNFSCKNSQLKKVTYNCLNNLLSSQNFIELTESTLWELFEGLKCSEPGEKIQCSSLLSNVSRRISYGMWEFLIEKGIVEILQDCLDSEKDPRLILDALYICTHMFLAGKMESDIKGDIVNKLRDTFEEKNGAEIIEDLISHKSSEISEFAKELFEEYFYTYAMNDSVTDNINVFNFS